MNQSAFSISTKEDISRMAYISAEDITQAKQMDLLTYLRKNMTKEERHLWYNFLKNYPVRFLRQKVIGNYIVLDVIRFAMKRY